MLIVFVVILLCFIFWFLVVVSVNFDLRNRRVFEEKKYVINKITSFIHKKYIDARNLVDERGESEKMLDDVVILQKQLFERFDAISYDAMYYKFWIPVESFYKDLKNEIELTD